MFNFLRKFAENKGVIHLDYASTTPVDAEVLQVMRPYWRDEWANPSAIYKSGVRVRKVIEESREKIARILHIRPSGVVFTSGGTESNNLALIGTVERLRQEGRAYADIEILTTKIEHASILVTVKELASRGVIVTYMPLLEDGRIDIGKCESLLNEKTALVVFAYVNSEIGVVQDVKRITRLMRAYSKARGLNGILVHLDAAQAPLWLPCEIDALGVDLIALDSGKYFGPKGAGVLAFRNGVSLAPVVFGGGQEGGLRSGTENAALIVGCVEAFLRAQGLWKSRSEATASLRDFMFERILKEIPGVVVNGSRESRVANNVNISIPGIDSEYAIITLDHHGVNASTKSACGASDASGSAVIRELTEDDARATSTIRFTLGPDTKTRELDEAVSILARHVKDVQNFTRTLKRPNV